MISYRKIGGIHWLSIGRLRISWCIKRQSWPELPRALSYQEVVQLNQDIATQNRRLNTYTNEEHNHFIF